MGWILSVIFLILSIMAPSESAAGAFAIAAGLFGISGAIGEVAVKLKK